MAYDALASLSTKIAADPGLTDRLKKAEDLDQLISVLRSAGIDIKKAEFLRAESERVLALSDAELESAHISVRYSTDTLWGCLTWALTCTCGNGC